MVFELSSQVCFHGKHTKSEFAVMHFMRVYRVKSTRICSVRTCFWENDRKKCINYRAAKTTRRAQKSYPAAERGRNISTTAEGEIRVQHIKSEIAVMLTRVLWGRGQKKHTAPRALRRMRDASLPHGGKNCGTCGMHDEWREFLYLMQTCCHPTQLTKFA